MLMRVTSIQSLRHIAELTVPKRRAVQSERSVFLRAAGGGGGVNACMRFSPEDFEKKNKEQKQNGWMKTEHLSMGAVEETGKKK